MSNSNASLGPLSLSCAVSILCIKNELNLDCIIRRLRAEGIKEVYVFTPDHYYSGKTTPRQQLEELNQLCRNVGAHHVVMPVTSFGGRVWDIETRIRNQILNRVHQSFQWNFIVDADELWVQGTGKLLANSLKANPRCRSIDGELIPYVGVPGYPVGHHTDKLLIGVQKGESFRHIRSVLQPQAIHHTGQILAHHFTAVRKTFPELIEKLRHSGHYGERDYDFEGWIKNVLPNLKPGWVGKAHMYRKYSIWDDIVHATAEQLMEIPEELARYLGDYQNKPRWKPQTISLLCPSRWRSEKAIHNLHDYWLKNAYDANKLEVIMVLHRDDETVPRYENNARQLLADKVRYQLVKSPHTNMNEGLNVGAKLAQGDILVSVFDDFEAPHHWDKEILERLTDQPGKCLFIFDGFRDVNAGIQTMGIMTHRCYKDWGYFWYGDYPHVYSDNDYAEHAELEKRIVWALDLTFEHRHYTRLGTRPDRTYQHSNRREVYEKGLALLTQRRARQFKN